MDKLKLVWENNPDTPITAENLSKIVDDYSEGQMVYFENDAYIQNSFGDDKLKLKANSLIKMSYPRTSALFDFNDSLVSHDSKTTPIVANNTTFRVESPLNNKKSLAIESGTTNISINSSFQSGFNGWTIEKSEPTVSTSIAEISSEGFDDNTCVKLSSDVSGHKISLSQIILLGNNTDIYSVSFYIKNTDTAGFIIIGDPNGDPKNWNDASKNWGAPSPLTIEPHSEWTRIELRDIHVTSLPPTGTEIKIQVYTMDNTALNQVYVDNFQVEKKSYPTSYISTTRDNSDFLLPLDIIDINKGTIEIEIRPNDLDEERTIFNIKTTSASVSAMRLYFDQTSNRLVFIARNTNGNLYKTAFIELNQNDYNGLVNNWQKIAVTWNKDVGIKLILNNLSYQLYEPYIPMDSTTLVEFQIGRTDSSLYAEALFSILKVNLLDNKDTQISNDFMYGIIPDDNMSLMFNSGNKSIELNEDKLDEGTSFIANQKYYLWLSTETIYEDECDIFISTRTTSPLSRSKYLSRIFGGFETDSSSNIIVESIWDVVSERNETLHTKKLVVNGTTAKDANFIVDSIPRGVDRITANVPLRTTDYIYSGDASNVYVTIDPVGSVRVDQLFIDNNIITSDSNLVLNCAASIDINSGSGNIYLDNIQIKNNSIFLSNAQDFTIQNSTAAKHLLLNSAGNLNLNATGGTINITSSSETKLNSNTTIAATKTLRFEDGLGEKIQLDRTTGDYTIGRQTDSLYMRTVDAISFYKAGAHSDTKYAPGSGGQLLAALTYNNIDPSAVISPDSHFYAGRVHNAVYNDLAECWKLKPSVGVEYGQVIVQTEDGARPSIARAEKGTIGVASDTYGFILGDEGFNTNLNKSTKVPIGISGRVKVWAEGFKYKIGDELVSSTHGFAIKANLIEKIFKRDRIIGRVDGFIEKIGINSLLWIKIQ